MRFLRHIAAVTTALAVFLGVPFLFSNSFRRLISSDPDAVSSATTIIDAPSGEFVVLINSSVRSSENLAVWKDFFSGKDIPLIFEDIVCGGASGDSSGLEMAVSYQSRLPENQMKLEQTDPVLLMSKADVGRFDVIVLSAEAAEKYGAESAGARPGTELLKVRRPSL